MSCTVINIYHYSSLFYRTRGKNMASEDWATRVKVYFCIAPSPSPSPSPILLHGFTRLIYFNSHL